MKITRILSLLMAIVTLTGLIFGVSAAQVDSDSTYCFTSQDFSQTQQVPVAGICITGLPDPATGTVMLGNRVLRSGDILTAGQLEEMTFCPLRTQEDTEAVVTYLPIYENRVEQAAQMTISIRGKEDKAPTLEDLAIETYKNLPNEGVLKAADPEGEALQFTVVRGPRRGEVAINSDGTFTYTPKKNKVGVDSFTVTATDPAGNVSREATVTVQILKPSDSRQYTDTAGLSCRFEAEWLKNTGLFTGESISGESCFGPDKAVSRGDFLAMLVKVLDIPVEEQDYSAVPTDVPLWLRPYVGAAMRSGLLEGCPDTQTGGFEGDSPISQAEAAVMVQNALQLASVQTAQLETEDVPAWACAAVTALTENGLSLMPLENLTRGEAAELLYEVNYLAVYAPGTQVFRMN